jgi:uncharacterized delta-60 repeat protein
MKQKLLVILLFISSVLINAQVTQEWVKRYIGPAGGNDWGLFVRSDAGGNVYITGISYRPGTLSAIVTIKYNSVGAVKWVALYDGPVNGEDRPNSMEIDNSGNVYITGTSEGAGANYDFITIKYNTDGALQWASRYNGPANLNDNANDIAVDIAGNVYVSGRSIGGGPYSGALVKYNALGIQQWVRRAEDSVDVGLKIGLDAAGNVYAAGLHSVTYLGGWDFSITKYDPAGTLQWRKFEHTGEEQISVDDAFVDASGNVYVVGLNGPYSNWNFITFKYNSAGIHQWSSYYDNLGDKDDPHAIAVDGAGNVFVTGETGTHISARTDCVTVKYNSAGTQQWVRFYNGEAGFDDYATSLAVDASGNVYLGGYTHVENLTRVTDYLVIKYSASGEQKWFRTYNGSANYYDAVNSIFVDDAGNIFVTGASTGFGTNSDFATIKYSQESSISSFIRDKIEIIKLKVDSLVLAQILPSNYGAMLKNNLEAAANQFSQGHPNTAIIRMNLFKFEVNLFVRRQILPPQTAQPLIVDADEVIALMQQGGNGNNITQIDEIKSFSLGQNYPNPFNPVTKIKFEIPFNGFVTLKIYDILGREAASVVNENLTAGLHEAEWNASDYSTGVYFYKLVLEYNGQKFEKIMKMIVVK